jgi:hypothetical protein
MLGGEGGLGIKWVELRLKLLEKQKITESEK